MSTSVQVRRPGRWPRRFEPVIPTASGPILDGSADRAPGGHSLERLASSFLRWSKQLRGFSDNTIAAYSYDLGAFLHFARTVGCRFVEDVSVPMIEAYFLWLRETRHCAPATVNRHRSCLVSFWRFLMHEGITRLNLPAVTYSVKAPKPLPRHLEVPDQMQFLDGLAALTDPVGRRDHAIVATMLLAGLRLSECAQLKLADVRLASHRLYVLQGKGAKDRIVVIVPKLKAVLSRYLDEIRPQLVERFPSEYVFVNANPTHGHRHRRSGQPLGTRGIFSSIRRRAVQILGCPLNPHALRHSFATALILKGADISLVQRALGHADINTTARYLHLPSEHVDQQITHLLGQAWAGSRQ